MKSQKYPVSFKKGSVLYCFDAFTYDDGKSGVELQEWVVRTIQLKKGSQTYQGYKLNLAEYHQTKYVNIAQKIANVTFFGGQWKKSLPERYRKQFIQGNDLPKGFYTTQLQALKFAIKEWEVDLKWCKSEVEQAETQEDSEIFTEDTLMYEKELKLLKGRLTRMNNAKKKAKAA